MAAKSSDEHNTNATSSAAPHSDSKAWVADAALFVVVIVWGSTFLIIKSALPQTSPLFFLAMRFTCAAAALTLAVLLRHELGDFVRGELWWGGLIGVALWLGFVLQTIGMDYTTASSAGFISSMSLVLVPLFSFFILHYRPTITAIIGIIVAIVGLFLLTVKGNFTVSAGDWLELGGTVPFALQIVLTSRFGKSFNPMRLALAEVSVCALLSLIASLIFELPVGGWRLSGGVIGAVVFLGVVATAIGLTVQTKAQDHTSAVHIALLFTMEPIAAAVFAYFFLGETLSMRALFGCTFIVAGMVLAQLGPYVRHLLHRIHLPLADRPYVQGCSRTTFAYLHGVLPGVGNGEANGRAYVSIQLLRLNQLFDRKCVRPTFGCDQQLYLAGLHLIGVVFKLAVANCNAQLLNVRWQFIGAT